MSSSTVAPNPTEPEALASAAPAHASQSIDKVRAEEAKRLERDDYEPGLEHSRWPLLERPENLTKEQYNTLRGLLEYKLRTGCGAARRTMMGLEKLARPLPIEKLRIGMLAEPSTSEREAIEQG